MSRMDITGMTFGKLYVEGFAYVKNEKTYWNCVCECGNKCIKAGKYLRNGDTKSCGCLIKETARSLGLSNTNRNIIESVDSNTSKIYFHNSDNFALCDTEDVEWLKDFTWHETEYGYARAEIGGKLFFMHDVILNITPDHKTGVCDHINRNRLDNRKCNLRVVPQSENTKNKSIYSNNKSGITGVSKSGNKWIATIGIDGRSKHIGTFDTIDEAIVARETEAVLNGIIGGSE